MTSTDHQLAIIRAAKDKGLDPSRLSPSQYRALALEVRTASEKVADGTSAIISRGLTGLKLRVVPTIVAEQNASVCRENRCGKYRKFDDGSEACDACNCQGKWLQSKWRDAREHCPLPEPLWDNRDKQAVTIDPIRTPDAGGPVSSRKET